MTMNDRIPGLRLTYGQLVSHVLLGLLVLLWTVPTAGLLISSFRDKDQLIVSGWWTALTNTERNERGRTGTDQVERNGEWIIAGSFFKATDSSRSIETYSNNQRDLGAFRPGEPIALEDGTVFTLAADGRYDWVSPEPFDLSRGKRFFFVANIPPRFSLENYVEVLTSEGISQAFINTLTVAVPATMIPILIAAFAAYAFSWMQFPGRQFLFVVVVGLLVVPLQMSLIPLLRLYNEVGSALGVEAKSYPGIWLAHTGFGLPLAIYLLRNYIGSLPKEIIESARVPLTGRRISRSSPAWCCRCRCRRWRRSRSSSSCGCGTICWWRWCSWASATTRSC